MDGKVDWLVKSGPDVINARGLCNNFTCCSTTKYPVIMKLSLLQWNILMHRRQLTKGFTSFSKAFIA